MYVHNEVYAEKHICCRYCGSGGEIIGKDRRRVGSTETYVDRFVFVCDRCNRYSHYEIGERITIDLMQIDRAIHLDNTVYEAEDDTKAAYKALIRKMRELREKYPHIY